MRKGFFLWLGLLVGLISFVGNADASLIQVGSPGTVMLTGPYAGMSYVGATQRGDSLDGYFGDATSVSTAYWTGTFADTGSSGAVSSTWATWSSPPDSETATPYIVTFLNAGALGTTITFDRDVQIAGFEIEPNSFGTHFLSASFYSGPDGTGIMLGSVGSLITGNAGARLLGGYLDTTAQGYIRSIVLSVPEAASGYAIANVRTDVVPEPATFALIGAGLLGLLLVRRRKA